MQWALGGIAFLHGQNDYVLMTLRSSAFTPMIVLLVFLHVPGVSVHAQASSDSLTHVLGAEYAAGRLRTFFLGAHWRSAWTTPLTVPLLDLGGRGEAWTVLREGGGYHTHKLYLRDAAGRRYLFRAINLDPALVWRPDLRKAVITRAMQDQITTQLPFAPVVAAELERAAGLDVARPRIVALPDSPALGAFRKNFAGLVGTLTQQPPDDTADADGIYRNVVGTYAMFAHLERSGSQQVDAHKFALARLMDILLGDWDRDAEQWRWRRVVLPDRTLWTPLPEDRDQAFSRFDGIIPSVVERVVLPLNGYDNLYPNIASLTWTGRHLDRRLLSPLSRSSWDSLAAIVVGRLGDEVLAHAVARLPSNWQDDIAPRLLERIRQRRRQLPALAAEYARLLNTCVDVHGSMDDERVEVRRDGDGSVLVTLARGMRPPTFQRRFVPEETREIRIYTHDGNDTVHVSGECDESIDVRVIGGPGNDVLLDDSFVHGYFLDITPFPRAEYSTAFYDDDAGTVIALGPGATFDGRETRPAETAADRYEPLHEDRGMLLRFDPRLTYNSDDGFIIGAGPELIRYGFRQRPFSWRMAGSAALATTSGKPQLEFDGRYQSIIPDIQLHLTLFHSELSFRRFYGFGNDSRRDDERDAEDYYQAGQEQINVRAALRYTVAGASFVEMGAAYRFVEVETTDGSFLQDLPQYGEGAFRYAELFGTITYDTRDHRRLPLRGFYAELRGQYFPVLLENGSHFADGSLDLRAYLSLHTQLTLALRTRLQHIWGRYPFYHAATIGGSGTLRGFNRERFAGDAAVLAMAELRGSLGRIRVIFPGEWGLLAFGDAGRVFLAGEESRTIHTSFGGGIWGGFADKRLTFSLHTALSRERLAFSLATGFTF